MTIFGTPQRIFFGGSTMQRAVSATIGGAVFFLASASWGAGAQEPADTAGAARGDQALRERIETLERQVRDLRADPDTKWHLAGYASAGFHASDAAGTEDSFEVGSVNPIFHFQYRDLALFQAEVELEVEADGATHLGLEYATIDLLLHDHAAIRVGRFLSPIGQFQSRLHPAWINKMPDAPAGFGHGGAQPLSELGVAVTGGFAAGPLYLANYTVFVSNGPRIEFGESGEPEGLELEGFGEDDHGSKAVGGRIGILPVPHFEIGGSFMTSQMETPGGHAGYALWGADASYSRGGVDLRAEYLSSELDSFVTVVEEPPDPPMEETVPETEFSAWYAQAAYRLSALAEAPFFRNLELVARYGEVDAEGSMHLVEHTAPERRLTAGLNYLFAPSLMAKFAFSVRDFEESEEANEFRAQLAYGF